MSDIQRIVKLEKLFETKKKQHVLELARRARNETHPDGMNDETNFVELADMHNLHPKRGIIGHV